MSALGDWIPNTRDKNARPFSVYDAASDLSDEFEARLYLLAVQRADVGGGIPLAYEQTEDAPTVAARLVDVLEGRAAMVDRFGHVDGERTRTMRGHLADARRKLGGNVVLAFAVKYGRKVRRKTHVPEFPTADMLASLGDTMVMGKPGARRRWNVSQEESALPASPHGRAVLALVGVDCKGRIYDALPQPNLAELDKWAGRNLRELARAALAHPDRAQLDTFCAAHGLEPMWAWLWIDQPARAA
jgi:hypothetical protein